MPLGACVNAGKAKHRSAHAQSVIEALCLELVDARFDDRRPTDFARINLHLRIMGVASLIITIANPPSSLELYRSECLLGRAFADAGTIN
jgi:hypothetical protein